jgi:hypothetical protein
MKAAAAKAQLSWRRIGLVAIITLAAVAALIGFALYFNPITSTHRSSHQFFSSVESKINPEELRIWAANLASRHGFGSKPTVSELPDDFAELSSQLPSILICSTNVSNEQPHVMLIYGGGFYHWGIDIGPTNFIRQNNPAFTTIQWVPGIYFRHEGQDQ